MLYELAITPDVFDPATVAEDAMHAVELRELLRELAVNGCIADLDKGEWGRLVSQCVEGWDSGLRMDVVKCLNRLRDLNRLVRHPKRERGHPKDDLEWLDLVLESHRRTPFDWIVIGSRLCLNGEEQDLQRSDVLGVRRSESWEARRRSISLRKCASEYRPVLNRLLRHAKRLEIVDPYLKANDGFVGLCASEMGQRGHATLPGEIHFHLWMDGYTSNEDVQGAVDEWTESLSKIKHRNRAPHTFKINIWGRKANGPKMHDRFLLTNQCGIQAGWGFDCLAEDTSNQTTWTLLDEATWNERRLEFRPDLSPYKHLGERIVK
jgi:hypothetical protein